ncbi:MAG: UDP-N-acetylmuramate-L-alanine ligase [candidate division TM6 bacterium GW2011_GWA2_36_9]|nr:MAG: UDP-N-acetylmuramate-L-alanine ligase [candidate division TM6 bacterium GW2011_GWA2_36_9]
MITYGLSEDADMCGKDLQLEKTTSHCTVYEKNNKLGTLELPLAGEHNIQNALGALAVACDLEIPFSTSADALKTLQGIERRFSYHGTYKGAELFDDYAHHPKEIASILKVARQRAQKKLHVVFQPHRFSRTYHLWNEFLNTFLTSQIDSLIITDIYPASEAPIPHISSEKLVAALQQQNPAFKTTYIPLDDEFNAIIKNLNEHIEKDDLILFLGAGKVYQIPYKLK